MGEVMKKIAKVWLAYWLSALLALQPALAATTPTTAPAIGTTFPQVVHNLPLTNDDVFGSGAPAPTDCAAGGTCVAIQNATQLANYFNYLQDSTQTVKINSEWEIYSPFTTSANYVFDTNDLALTGTLDAGGNVNVLV